MLMLGSKFSFSSSYSVFSLTKIFSVFRSECTILFSANNSKAFATFNIINLSSFWFFLILSYRGL